MGRFRFGFFSPHTRTCSPPRWQARRSPTWSATTAIITGVRASRKPITLRRASSEWRCRLYEDLQAYIRNSAVFNVQNMTTPLLIEVGDSDGTVFYHQGVELYNIARRAKKNVVLLVYGGEDHGSSKEGGPGRL